MKKSMLLLSALALSMAFTIQADEVSTSETKIEVKKDKKSDKADEIITNKRFRATQGSLSAWSFNSSWTYSGGSIDSPIGASRPNITGANDVALIQNFSGNLGVSYRINTKDRLTLGFGVQMASPFSSTADENFSGQARSEFDETQGKLDANDPRVAYSHIFKAFGVQAIAGSSLTWYTRDALTSRGYQAYVDASLNTMYDIGKTGLSVGMLFSGGRYTHDNDDLALRARQVETVFYALPQAEYVINDTFNLRTIVRSWWYQNLRSQTFSNWDKLALTQSVGLGISVTRDIFLYPNIQFAPDNIRADRTNVGLTANINLF